LYSCFNFTTAIRGKEIYFLSTTNIPVNANSNITPITLLLLGVYLG